MERITVAPDGKGFSLVESRRPFHPWGLNYGNNGRLMEDYWETEWETLADDFLEMKALGANVARVHLQFGAFMKTADMPSAEAFDRLRRLVELAQSTGIYLDLTGLACYRPADVPPWYDALDEQERWAAQARFWEAVAATCADRSSIFCYDLMNEPISPAEKRETGQWYSGLLFGGYDFIQCISLDPAGRSRSEVARQWIETLSAAIRKHDRRTLITVGQLPWNSDWGHFSGFVPEDVAPVLDFLSVHIYPETAKPDEPIEVLRRFDIGKPVVIEETFPLSCGREQLIAFLIASRDVACGWMGHYDGITPAEYIASRESNTLTMDQSLWLQWLEIFQELKPEMIGP